MLDEIALARFTAADSASATSLGAVGPNGQALDVTLVTDGDDDLFAGDQRFQIKFTDLAGNFRATIVAVLLFHLQRVFANNVQDEILIAKYRLVAFDLLSDPAIFI